MAHLSILDKNSNLISRKDWEEKINRLVADFKDLTLDKNTAKQKIKESLIHAVLKRSNKPKLGVLFSGGLDSTLITKILKDNNTDFKCICVAFDNSSDLEFAKKAKKLFNLDLCVKIITQKDLKEHLPIILRIIKDTDVVKTEVAIVVYFGLLEAKKQNIEYLFAGGGSEEIFCGYQKHLELYKKGERQLHKDSISGLISMYDRDLTRDFALANYFGIDLLLPFLDLDLVKEAMSIHPNLKTDGINKKIILREVSLDIGLPKDFSQRKRTAAQYGSRVSTHLSKLTRKSGFRTKLEFLKNIKK